MKNHAVKSQWNFTDGGVICSLNILPVYDFDLFSLVLFTLAKVSTKMQKRKRKREYIYIYTLCKIPMARLMLVERMSQIWSRLFIEIMYNTLSSHPTVWSIEEETVWQRTEKKEDRKRKYICVFFLYVFIAFAQRRKKTVK